MAEQEIDPIKNILFIVRNIGGIYAFSHIDASSLFEGGGVILEDIFAVLDDEVRN